MADASESLGQIAATPRIGGALRTGLRASSLVELAAGAAFALQPALVLQLLLGFEPSIAAIVPGRIAGLALLALGTACYPNRGFSSENLGPARRAMLVYNGLVAGYLAYLGAIGISGPTLWPSVVVHAGLFGLLARRPVVIGVRDSRHPVI